MKISAKDIAAVVGLSSLGVGVGMIHIPSALIVVGSLVFILSVYSVIRGR